MCFPVDAPAQAVKIAKGLGLHVTVISTSLKKKEEALTVRESERQAGLP
jgi:hypothetical protein